MARINLLPWREQQREERKRRFLTVLAGTLVAALLVVLLADRYLDAALERQNARNEFIRREIALLDVQIKEIKALRERRQQLVERMKIIQDLQGNRPIIARVFEQLVRTLPEGVYFTELKMTGPNIAIVGGAESNNRVSKLMRNLDGSQWLESPNLIEVKALTSGALEQQSLFQLSVQQTKPVQAGEGGGQ